MSQDKDGRIFLDFNPTYLAFILDDLRAKKIPTAEEPVTLPKFASDQVNNSHTLFSSFAIGLFSDRLNQILLCILSLDYLSL